MGLRIASVGLAELIVALALFPATAFAAPKDSAQQEAAARSRALFDEPTTMRNDAGGTIDFDELRLENNLWNAGALKAGTYEQSVFYRQGADGPLFGWKWSFAKEGVNAYPEVIYGWKPWFGSSTTQALPRPIADCGVLKVDYSVDLQFKRKGSWNLAFDNWITSGPGKPTGSTTKFEFMIWEDKSGLTAFGSAKGKVKTTNGDYTLYVGEPTWEPSGYNWTYLAFVRSKGRRAGTVDVDEMLKYLVDKKIVSADFYLASIEFGNEAGNSACEAVVDTFKVRFE
jgi:hypothetical protein